jgi:hypothetical protein
MFSDLEGSAAELLGVNAKVSRIPALQLRLCCSGNRDFKPSLAAIIPRLEQCRRPANPLISADK